MPAGTPIRLVRENGSTIELDAQSMVLTTTRKVGGKPLPFSGSRRIGMDLNMNSAMINIQGIIADDRTESGGSKGYALINFGKQGGARGGISFNEYDNLEALVSGEGLKLENMTGYVRSISFTQTNDSTEYSATGGDGSTPTVLVNTTDATGTDIARAVVALINAQFSADFTATAVYAEDSDLITTEDIAAEIYMTTKGAVLNNISPYFDGGSSEWFNGASITPFLGGAEDTKKSAGDKAMDLYGILNNSTTTSGAVAQTIMAGGLFALLGLGAAAVLAAGVTAVAVVGAGGGAITGAAVGGAREIFGHDRGYILGIQIPYNSMIQAGDGELYTARNFFMPTGGKSTSGIGSNDYEKTSNSNTSPASAKMNWDTGEKAGIQGSVQKMDITYDAGETVYQFNMIFAPVDNLL